MVHDDVLIDVVMLCLDDLLGEFRDGKLNVFVHRARLLPMLSRNGKTNLTSKENKLWRQIGTTTVHTRTLRQKFAKTTQQSMWRGTLNTGGTMPISGYVRAERRTGRDWSCSSASDGRKDQYVCACADSATAGVVTTCTDLQRRARTGLARVATASASVKERR